MVKKIAKIAGYGIAGIMVLILLIIGYVVNFLPHIGALRQLKVDITPQRIQHGRYLAMNVAGCIDCHSRRDDSRYARPLVDGTLGEGGFHFMIPEGTVVAPNISSDQETGIGNWTDGELFRAITSGVSKGGRPLFPIMPYQSFGKMDREDIYDIMAFIRTLPPIHHPVEKTSLHFPMNVIVHTIPQNPDLSTRPRPSDSGRYAAYITNVAGCTHCHSLRDKGKEIAGREFSGGFVLPLSNGRIARSANITPDQETGIGSWSREMFVQRFKSCLDSTYARPITPNDHQTEMPWTFYAGMKESDLQAIYAYLRTVKPVRNQVSHFGTR